MARPRRERPGPVPVRRRPPGYPAHYERWVDLDDGRRVFLRPILPSDAADLAEAIRSADPETLRLRFLGGPPPVTDALLAHLTEVDYDRHFAMTARAEDGTGVGIGRYVAPTSAQDAETEGAEVAVAVTPEWRRVGVATALVKALAERAIECHIPAFTASFVAGNRPVAELAQEGHARVVVSQGAAMLRAQLSAAGLEEWAAVEGGTGSGTSTG